MFQPKGLHASKVRISSGTRDISSPDTRRLQTLRAAWQANEKMDRPPFSGVPVRTLGELLYILLDRGWRGGLVDNSAAATELASLSKWFRESRRQWDPSELRPADLRGIDLRGVDLTDADLRDADLRGAILENAVLLNAALAGTILEQDSIIAAQLISQERATALRHRFEANIRDAKAPYAGEVLYSRNELLWIQCERNWFYDITALNPERLIPDLREVDLVRVDLSGSDFDHVILEGAVLIPQEVENYLHEAYDDNIANKRAPFEDVALGEEAVLRNSSLSRIHAVRPLYASNALLWIQRTHAWTTHPIQQSTKPAYHMSRINLRGADIRGAKLCKANLRGAMLRDVVADGVDLRCASLRHANLTNVSATVSPMFLYDADLRGATLCRADLRDADLRVSDLANANLRGTILTQANLRGASLDHADLGNTDLVFADLRQSNMRGARLNAETKLSGAKLDSQTQLGDVNWNSGVSLLGIDWTQAQMLGDEYRIAAMKRQGAYDPEDLTELRRQAQQSYLALASILRSQGLVSAASNYRLREQRLERQLLRHDGPFLRWIGPWTFSIFLDILAGFGERPMRVFIYYPLTILGFAVLDFAVYKLSLGRSLPLQDYLYFSAYAFHGRGFFPGPDQVTDATLIPLFAWIESVIGLIIEITFIASFTRRFLGGS